MERPFFDFAELDVEIERKLASLDMPPEQLAAALVESLPPARREGVRTLWRALAAHSFDDLYPNYLTHPLRVAASYAALRPDASDDDVALALCHNAREAGVLEHLPLAPHVARAIEVLTIDRERERDPQHLTAFYDAVESKGLMLLKALDKLDNALAWVLYEVEPHDVAVVLEQVCPRVERVHRRLAAYLSDATHYVLSTEAKARFAPVL